RSARARTSPRRSGTRGRGRAATGTRGTGPRGRRGRTDPTPRSNLRSRLDLSSRGRLGNLSDMTVTVVTGAASGMGRSCVDVLQGTTGHIVAVAVRQTALEGQTARQ